MEVETIKTAAKSMYGCMATSHFNTAGMGCPPALSVTRPRSSCSMRLLPLYTC